MLGDTDADRKKRIKDIERFAEKMKAESAESRRRWYRLRVDDDGRAYTEWFRKEDDGTSTPVASTRQ